MGLKEYSKEIMTKIDKGTVSKVDGEKLINDKIIEKLKEFKKGEILAKIYELKCEGMTQADIAKQCGVSSSVVFDFVTRLRRLIKQLEREEINLSYFKNFEPKPHNYSEETLKKQEERRNSRVAKPRQLTENQKRSRELFGFALSLGEEYRERDLNDASVIEEINTKIVDFYNGRGNELLAKIYQLKCAGKTNIDIAKQCDVSPSIVETRLEKIRNLLRITRFEGEHFKKFEPKFRNTKNKRN